MTGKPYRNQYLLAIFAGILLVTPAIGQPPQPATADEIAAMISEVGKTDKYDGANLVYILDEADVFVQKTGLATTQSGQVIKVLTDAGVKSQSVQTFDFDPDTRRVSIDSLRIHKEDGQTVEVPLDSIITQPTPQHMIYWGGKQHLLNVPGLDIGDCIEMRVSKTGFNIAYLNGSEDGNGRETLEPPMPGHWYEVTLFQNRHPIVNKRYSVHMPKDMPVQYEVYNGELKSSLWFSGNNLIYTWFAKDIPAIKKEPRMDALDDCVTKLVMATVPDWEMKSRWFHEVNEPQFEANDEIIAKVKEITAGMTSLQDKIAACNHWVADNVRYCGTSRGPREGFTLHTGIETFKDRAGVCKDKAGMLVTMLRVLGVEAYPALTMAGSRVEDIPADQFNHTVTVVREKNGDFTIYDPTWIPQSREMWSSREDLQGLVYGVPEGETLTLSPYYSPEYNRLIARSNAQLTSDGQLAMNISMDMHGYPCTYLRRYIDRYPKPELKAQFEKVLNIAPNAILESYSHTEPTDYSQDSKVNLDVQADGYVAGTDAIHMFKLPLMSHPLADWLIPDLFYSMNDQERQFGYHLRATRGVTYEETIKLPKGWKAKNLPDAVEMDSPSAYLKFEIKQNSGELSYTFRIDLKNHIIPAKDYAEVKKALEAMKDISDQWIICKVAGEDVSLADSSTAGETAQGGIQ